MTSNLPDKSYSISQWEKDLCTSGSLIHIWLNCPKTSPFWKVVEPHIDNICSSTLTLTPKLVLLTSTDCNSLQIIYLAY